MTYNIPKQFENVLKELAPSLPDNYTYDELVNAVYTSFFAFWTPSKLTAAMAADLEKFILHYFMLRRIGVPNEKKWIEIFRNQWRTLIPYYERLLETQEKETNYFSNPIRTADITRSGSNSKSGSGSNTQTTSSSELNKYLDTPQNDLSALELNRYLTDVRQISDSGSLTGSNSDTEEGEFSETRTGYDGKSPVELLQIYRESFLRIYEDLAAELNQVFYNIVVFEDYDEE